MIHAGLAAASTLKVRFAYATFVVLGALDASTCLVSILSDKLRNGDVHTACRALNDELRSHCPVRDVAMMTLAQFEQNDR